MSAQAPVLDVISAHPPEPLPPPSAANWTSALLADNPTSSLAFEARRVLTGLGLAAAFGFATGTREGGAAFVRGALGVPLGLVLASAIGLPALFIGTSLVDAPIDTSRIGRAASRAIATAGLVLAGCAPAAALFVVSSEQLGSARIASMLGLYVGAAIGYRRLFLDLITATSPNDRAAGQAPTKNGAVVWALAAFGLFGFALCSRVWCAVLPLLGGRS